MDDSIGIRSVVKSYDVHFQASLFRMEILQTGNPKMPYSAHCYRRIEDERGNWMWAMIDDFPWLAARTEGAAVAEANLFLKDRLERLAASVRPASQE